MFTADQYTADSQNNPIRIFKYSFFTFNISLFLQCMNQPLMCVIVPIRRKDRISRSAPLILPLRLDVTWLNEKTSAAILQRETDQIKHNSVTQIRGCLPVNNPDPLH